MQRTSKARPRDPDGELLLSRRERAEELRDLSRREGMEPLEAILAIMARMAKVRRLKDQAGGRTLRRGELNRALRRRR